MAASVSLNVFWHEKGLRRGRDIALGAVPAAFVMGFISWAAYARNLGLGRLPAGYEQYVSLGIIGLATTAVLLLGFVIAVAFTEVFSSMMARSLLLPFSVAIFGGLSMLFVALILEGLTLARASSDLYIISFLLGALTMFLVWLTIIWLQVCGTGIYFFDQGEDEGRSLVITWPLLITAFYVATIALPVGMAGEIDPAFGGPSPRVAVLELERSALSNVTGSLLVPNWENATASVVHSEKVWVFGSSSARYLVRLHSDIANAPLIELNGRVVLAIYWIE